MSNTTLLNRAVIRLSGDDVRGFLQGLVTNDTSGDLPVWAALLTPQGKAMFDFFLWADGEDVLVDCEAGAADALVKRLTLYRLRRPISIAVEPALAVHWAKDGEQGVSDPRLAAIGRRWLAAASSEVAGADAAYLAHRLSLGVTEGQAELGDILWLETNAAELNGVSFTKGCYVGQENTARMNWRQKINRRLIVVPLADANEKRQRVAYPELGLSVEHLRVEDVPVDKMPSWMAAE
ncbi:CAF17-like 4Fe-4S cluster assembly/insertion protein YgfZ [Sphingopyxis yananensis]|uniref:CAF17-like 4Fe-4S cluster assembly/insertion protein YgfZ n=1 Tax=Sphingopyxis yananensis TaxID=2886687 RepID=UPI001D10F89C|nr:folate-binding protein [Sphingopyxis yananensis]MCC2602172.1 folate-binding protein [Sphingopyxis yananensis]